MKEYLYEVKIEWGGVGIEAKNKKKAIECVKEIFMNEYNLELKDNEITITEEK